MPGPDAMDSLVRLGVSAAAGIVLGMEREAHGRAAGLRTVVLVCLAATTAMILSEGLAGGPDPAGGWRPDPARLAAGVLTGIGFIGAGAIVRHGHLVRGVTTAAVIWLAAIVGLCCGAGRLWLGVGAAMAGTCALVLLNAVEALADNDWYADLVLVLEGPRPETDTLVLTLAGFGVRVKRISIESDLVHGRHTVRLGLKLKRSRDHGARVAVMDHVAVLPGVRSMEWNA